MLLTSTDGFLFEPDAMKLRFLTAIAIVAAAGAGWLAARHFSDDSRAGASEPALRLRSEPLAKPRLLEVSSDSNQPSGFTGTTPSFSPMPASAAKQVGLVFPDGETIPVQLKDLPPFPDLDRRLAPLIERYAELRRRAEAGEAAAAMSLYVGLDICRNAFADGVSLERAVQQLRRGEVVTLPDPRRAPLHADTVEKVSELESLLKQSYESCQGMTQQQRQEAETWLRTAAALGEYTAQQRVAVLLGNTQDALAAWESLWMQGHDSALPSLAFRHLNGVDGGPPDRVRAYAYQFLNFKLAEVSYQNPPSRMNATVLQAMQDALDYSGGFLNPQQQAEAVQLAKQLLSENRNCCVGVW